VPISDLDDGRERVLSGEDVAEGGELGKEGVEFFDVVEGVGVFIGDDEVLGWDCRFHFTTCFHVYFAPQK